MKIKLLGNGKMGKLIEKMAKEKGLLLAPEIPEADVCIDFSHPEAVWGHLEQACAHKKNIVIGTTGWHHDLSKAEKLVKKSGIGAIYSPNFSIGVQLFFKMVEHCARMMRDVEEYEAAILEMHHSQKVDMPSGTGLALSEIVGGKCPVTSVRAGSIPGTHTVLFDSAFDQITLTHEARSREGFAKGALFAAQWICGKKGFYHFKDIWN